MALSRLKILLATATLFGFFSNSVTAEELSVGTFVPPSHETNVGMFKWFGEEIEKRSGGTLTMKLYPAGQLGAGPVQQYKRTIEGVADITFGVAALTPKIFPKTMLAILPGKATILKIQNSQPSELLTSCRIHDLHLHSATVVPETVASPCI